MPSRQLFSCDEEAASFSNRFSTLMIFACPNCDQHLDVEGGGAGRTIHCPTCGQAVIIPEPSAILRPPRRTGDNGAASADPCRRCNLSPRERKPLIKRRKRMRLRKSSPVFDCVCPRWIRLCDVSVSGNTAANLGSPNELCVSGFQRNRRRKQSRYRKRLPNQQCGRMQLHGWRSTKIIGQRK